MIIFMAEIKKLHNTPTNYFHKSMYLSFTFYNKFLQEMKCSFTMGQFKKEKINVAKRKLVKADGCVNM